METEYFSETFAYQTSMQRHNPEDQNIICINILFYERGHDFISSFSLWWAYTHKLRSWMQYIIITVPEEVISKRNLGENAPT
jgi:hypothetical protein